MSRLRILLKTWLARVTLVMEFCHACGRAVDVVWTADDALWTTVMGRSDGGGIRCVGCFDREAAELGYFIRWTPVVERRR